MGHPAIFTVAADSHRSHYYSHWGGASVFSVFRRFACAMDVHERHPDKSLHDILEHLGDDGEYAEQVESRADLIFERISLRSKRAYDKDFNRTGYFDLRVTLNVDTNTAFIEHNRFKSYYENVGNVYIPLDQGLYNVRRVCDHAEQIGVEDVFEAAAIFEQQTGLRTLYQSAKEGALKPPQNRQKPTSSQIAMRLAFPSQEDEPEEIER